MTPLQFRLSSLASYSLVTVQGELDVTNSGELLRRLLAVVEEADEAVIVDLQWLRLCDAATLSAFVVADRCARDRQVVVELAGARGGVATVFTLPGLTDGLNLRTDVYEAVRVLQDLRPSLPVPVPGNPGPLA